MGDYQEKTVQALLNSLGECENRYKEFYNSCFHELEESAHSGIDNQAIRGIANAAGFLGGVIGSIPIIRQGPVDEALDDASKFLKGVSRDTVDGMLNDFRKNECTDSDVFAENARMIDSHFNKPIALVTDGEQIMVKCLPSA